MNATPHNSRYHSLVAIGQVTSLLLAVISGALMVTTAVSLGMDDSPKVVRGFLLTFLVTASLATLFYYVCRQRLGRRTLETSARDGFVSVGLGWLVVSVIAAIAFRLTIGIPWADAIFETSSGLTTTGATILGDSALFEAPKGCLDAAKPAFGYGILFWRAMLNWLGGVGIVFFVLLLLPMLKLGQSKMLYNAEVPGLKTTADQTTPHLATSVWCVLGVYGGLTLAAILLYHIFGMTWFDAVCHAFSTISTGGFSPRADGLAHYNHLPALQWIVVLFMFLSACNFSLHIQRFTSLKVVYWKDEEFRFFFIVVLVAIGFVATSLGLSGVSRKMLFLNGEEGITFVSVEEYLRVAAFQVVTVLSTTGFCNGNWESWGISSVLLLIAILMVPCGCGGSTAGGMKWSRIVVLFKQLSLEIRRCISPRMVQDIRLNNERLDSGVVGKTLAFVALYAIITLAVALLLSVFEPMAKDVSTAFGAALTSLSNVGPGFGAVNPAGNFAEFNCISKLLLALTMIIGRLELFTIIVLFLPSTWKK
ncbi:MAG: TrkH family potassium uptake protein [Victivallales bacterium]|nr:TrkH family potassium uptake protein [Victivallales bacterium]